MKLIEELTIRELQKESARALTTMQATSNNIWKFNKEAHHDSHKWYVAVITWYFEKYGGLPSKIGPASEIKLILDN